MAGLQQSQVDLEAAQTAAEGLRIQLEDVLGRATAGEQRGEEQAARIAQLEGEVAEYVRLVDGERVGCVDALLVTAQKKCAEQQALILPLERALSECRAQAHRDALELREALAKAQGEARAERGQCQEWRRRYEDNEREAEVQEGRADTASAQLEAQRRVLDDALATLAALTLEHSVLGTEKALAAAEAKHLRAAVDAGALERVSLVEAVAALEATKADLTATAAARQGRIVDRENLILDMQVRNIPFCCSLLCSRTL